jgi:hypothetical protein
MNAAEALRSIRYEWLSYIQEKINVEFDNAMQEPFHFTHRETSHMVREVLGRFRARDDGLMNGFLVKADDSEVYFLYFHRIGADHPVSEGYWVLKLLSSHPEDLFDVVDAGGRTVQTMQTPAAYPSCAGCGQQVLKEHAAESRGKLYRAPCLQVIERPKAGQSLH